MLGVCVSLSVVPVVGRGGGATGTPPTRQTISLLCSSISFLYVLIAIFFQSCSEYLAARHCLTFSFEPCCFYQWDSGPIQSREQIMSANNFYHHSCTKKIEKTKETWVFFFVFFFSIKWVFIIKQALHFRNQMGFKTFLCIFIQTNNVFFSSFAIFFAKSGISLLCVGKINQSSLRYSVLQSLFSLVFKKQIIHLPSSFFVKR